MARHTSCTLSSANLLHNLEAMRRAAKGKRIMAMVKANAYGHGLRSVAQRLDGLVDSLGVASIDEAMALREAGIKGTITLIEGVFTPDELAVAATQGFQVVFHSAKQVEWLVAAILPKPLFAWLKVYTGMGRLGFPADIAGAAMDALSGSSNIIQPVGIMSHFACADEPEHPLNAQQIETFKLLFQGHAGPRSLCNSAGILTFPDHQHDWVRPGIALYGASPFADKSAADIGLKPVMTFKTKLISVQMHKKGSSIGYGARYVCPEDMPIGIMAVGYGDGYPRSARDGTPVLVEGVRCGLAGRVSMDMAAIDLRPVPHAQVGSDVTLWGYGLPLEDVAPRTSNIVYDLLTGIQNRVKFEWV
ncbi:MAG: alanine racemase [Proteobacteria bacterium]|nr:alanine racemase [Pseudomonadota bacterium]